MNKDERIVKIYEILSHNALNITELSNRLNVSTKTIERDLKNPLFKEVLEKQGQKYKINQINQDNFVINVLEEMSLSLGSDFYKKAKKFLRCGGGGTDSYQISRFLLI